MLSAVIANRSLPTAPSEEAKRRPDQIEAHVWLTAEEAAAYLKVKSRTILLWAREGRLKGYTLSGLKRHVWRFQQHDLDAMMHAPSALSESRRIQ
jgi:excisionase family DNA binding protein